MSTSYVIEALTPRELTIVELLPTHLSYVQIGEQLFVSVNTVKSNLKSIYRKLGVGNRFEAVAAARELGLIPPGSS
jgi:LuxR family maltose regulon positive regulatory protein